MLRPENRNLFLDSMRPPPGYTFDRAVGTTFTLDLLSLLITPLAFTFFDWEDRDGRPTAEPLALLEALRRHASHIHLFCQAGMINVPPADKQLLPYIESSVFEVHAPKKGGLFHPKVWLLRFVSDDEPCMYRLMCLSRNLTFARSWDTVLVLDGVLTDRKLAIAKNHPLGEFIESLPGMARHVPEDVEGTIAQMAQEVRRVAFEPPEGFRDFAFWPVGLDRRYKWPFPEEDRPFLVMSPFLGDWFLKEIKQQGQLRFVISRPESLAAVSEESLEKVEECLVMEEGSALDVNDGDAEAATDGLDDDNELAGLHAKLFVMDEGWEARIWTGSANATRAAFHNNIEFLVELTGLKSRCGIKALLGGDGSQHTLRGLLVPYEPDSEEPPDGDDEARHYLNAAREKLIDLRLEAHVSVEDENQYAIALRCPGNHRWRPPKDLSVKAWPVTLQHSAELSVGAKTAASFEGLSLEAITAFFAFDVRVAPGSGIGGKKKVAPLRFVLTLPLHGAPADRKDCILQSLLKDQDHVMRLLLLLLAGESLSVSDFAMDSVHGSVGTATSFGVFDTGTLLESLLRALARDPTAIEQVANVVDDLKKTPEGQQLIPDGFDEIWAPIWECYAEGRK